MIVRFSLALAATIVAAVAVSQPAFAQGSLFGGTPQQNHNVAFYIVILALVVLAIIVAGSPSNKNSTQKKSKLAPFKRRRKILNSKPRATRKRKAIAPILKPEVSVPSRAADPIRKSKPQPEPKPEPKPKPKRQAATPVVTAPIIEPKAPPPQRAGKLVAVVKRKPVKASTALVPVVRLPPNQPMLLKLKRSQKEGRFGAIIYMLDARIDVSAEVAALITKHKLGKRVIYESEARQLHAARAQAHLKDSRDSTRIFAPPSEQAMGAAKTFWKLGRAAVSAARASFSLRVTVNSLQAGVHVECKDMDELLEAENAFREAKENLEAYIDTFQTFDGREQVI